MNASVIRTRRLLIGGASGLIAVTALGGGVLAAAEGTGYSDGLALAFSTTSTTGFGPGPQTGWGLAWAMTVFAAGAACWFAIIVAAFETGLRRSRASIGGNGYASVETDLTGRSLPRGPRGHG